MPGETPQPPHKRGKAPPVVTHAPDGFGDFARSSDWSKRTLVVTLLMTGALAAGVIALAESQRHRDCAPNAMAPDYACANSSSRGGSVGSSSSHAYSSGSSSHTSGSSSAHAASFGGFGGAGAGHGGGGE
jgi:hypothetical protein